MTTTVYAGAGKPMFLKPAIHATAQAFLDELPEALPSPVAAVLSALGEGLTADGVFSKLHWLWLPGLPALTAPNENAARLRNFVLPTELATAGGGMTFNEGANALGDGTTGYVNSGRVSSAANIAPTDGTLFALVDQALESGPWPLCGWVNNRGQIRHSSSLTVKGWFASTTAVDSGVNGADGDFVAVTHSGTTHRLYLNGPSTVATGIGGAVGSTSAAIGLYGIQAASLYSSVPLKASGWSKVALSDVELAALRTRLATFSTDLAAALA